MDNTNITTLRGTPAPRYVPGTCTCCGRKVKTPAGFARVEVQASDLDAGFHGSIRYVDASANVPGATYSVQPIGPECAKRS